MKRVLCIGEVLWDIIGEEKYLGGAPLNAAANLAALGAEPWVVSCLGRDGLGFEAEEKMRLAGINTELVSFSGELPTGTAVVHPELDGNERFELPFPVAYDGIAPGALPDFCPDGLVFGSLGSYRSESVKSTVLAALEAYPRAVSLYDVNLRKAYFDRELISALASRSTVMKLNDGEAELLSPVLFGRALDIPGFARCAVKEFGCDYVVVTKGEKGAEMFWRDGCAAVAGVDTCVVDTVGAGDAFSAGVIFGLMNGASPEEALDLGNRSGAACVAHAGAFPIKQA